jgi:hypothetical protein
MEVNPFWSGDIGPSMSPIMPMMALANVLGESSLERSDKKCEVPS